jgi:hypothetical protein
VPKLGLERGLRAADALGSALFLVLHTGAPIVGAFIERRPDEGHRVKVVRPEEWVWWHRRWRDPRSRASLGEMPQVLEKAQDY